MDAGCFSSEADDPLGAHIGSVPCVIYDPAELWRVLEGSLYRRLPLQHVVWHRGSGLMMTLSQITCHFIRDSAVKALPSLPICWYREPYVHIRIVQCESPVVYKETVRAVLRGWVEEMSGAQKEWLIVYLPLGLGAGGSGEGGRVRLSRQATAAAKAQRQVLDKLVSDFGSSNRYAISSYRGKERKGGAFGGGWGGNSTDGRVTRVDLFLSSVGEAAAAGVSPAQQWEDFTGRLGGCIAASLNRVVGLYESALEARYANNALPGWNYVSHRVFVTPLRVQLPPSCSPHMYC
jgi:hypothetical protein